ncbi:MAG TPA: LysR family transcriptional regulator [Usitatibacteraceae bacterium]
MELYQLRSFAAIAELGQLTRAAEKLHISQPALSAQLRALEDEFDLVLFERSPNGMVLTATGQRFLLEAEKILAAAQELKNVARVLKGELVGKVSIGTLSDPGLTRVGEFMSAAVMRYPLLQLELHQGVTGVSFDQVRDGSLDAGFFYGELHHPAVAGLLLRKLVFRVAAPAAWQERIANADWQQIARLPWVIPPEISTHHHLAHALFDAHGVKPERVFEADQEAVIASLVVSGIGIALMREEIALEKAAHGEVCLWGDVQIVTPLWFIYQRERENDPAIRAMLDLQADIWELRESDGKGAVMAANVKPASRARESA